MPLLFVLATVLLTVYAQIILKWRIGVHGDLPDALSPRAVYLAQLFFDPYVLSGLVAGIVAALFWMMALTSLELSYAYPLTSLSFVLVFVLATVIFGESISVWKVIGLVLVVAGIVVTSRSG